MTEAADEPASTGRALGGWISYREALARVRATHAGYDDAAAHEALMRWLDAGAVRCTDPNGRPLTSCELGQWTMVPAVGQPRDRPRFTPFDLWNATAAARLEGSRWWGVPEAREAARSGAAKGGRPPNAYWHALGVEVGAWLADDGAPHTAEPVVEFVRQRLAHHGYDEPDVKRIRDWAERYLDAYRRFRGP